VVGVGEAVETIQTLGDSYETAAGVLAAALLRGEGGVSVWRELEGKTGKRESLSSDQKWGTKIASALKTGDRDEADRCVNEMMDYFKKVPLLPDECHLKCTLVLAAIMQSLEDMDIFWPDIFPHSLDPFADLRQLKNLDEVRLWFMALVKAVNDYTTSRQNNFAMVKVREALEYLEVHYEDPDLSLQELCRKLDISSSYLSASLKKYHDKSFVDELTGIRMRKAMELLKTTNFLTYEIAERVGYRDAHYFSLSFRKFTGMTSTEYRNRNVHVPG
jgi:two-component system response regulator YesN